MLLFHARNFHNRLELFQTMKVHLVIPLAILFIKVKLAPWNPHGVHSYVSIGSRAFQ